MRINCEDILSLLVQSLAAETDWFLCLKEWMMIFVYTLSIEPVDWELEQNRTEQNVIILRNVCCIQCEETQDAHYSLC